MTAVTPVAQGTETSSAVQLIV